MRAVWWIAVVMLGCFAPDYQSGKTKCSPAGECPTGFTCVAGVCVSSCIFDQSSFDDGTVFQMMEQP